MLVGVLVVILLMLAGCSNQGLESSRLGLKLASFEISQSGQATTTIRVLNASSTARIHISCSSGPASLLAKKGTSAWVAVASFNCLGSETTEVTISADDLVRSLRAQGEIAEPPTLEVLFKLALNDAESRPRLFRLIWTEVPLTGTLIRLADGLSVTNSAVVTLSSSAQFPGDGWSAPPAYIYITNQPGCSTGGVWQPYFPLIAVVPLESLDQLNTKYVAFRDDIGNVSGCFQTSILHDATPPNLTSVLINGGDPQTSLPQVLLTVNASGADLTQMAVFLNSNCSGNPNWISFSASSNVQFPTEGLQFISVRVRDLAGNASGCVSDAIVFDTLPPTAPSGIGLAGGLTATDNEASISLLVSGLIDGDTAVVYSDPACTVSIGSAVSLNDEALVAYLVPADGAYSFYARARDPDGRLSPCTTSPAIYNLDRVGPSVQLVTSALPNGDYTTGSTVSAQVVFTDPVLVTGTPRLSLDVNGTAVLATYSGGSGSATLSFSFVVSSSMTEDDLNISSTSGLTLPSGAAIVDLIGNPANTTLPDPAAASALAQQRNLQINFLVSLSQAYGPAEGIYGTGDTPEYSLIWTGPLTVTATPDLNLTVGASPTTAAYQSRSTPLLGITKFQQPALTTQLDTDGLTLLSINPASAFNNIFASPANTSVPAPISQLTGARFLGGAIPQHSFGTSASDHLQSVSESDGSAQLGVQLSSPALETTRINYRIRSATATEGVDFTGQTGFVDIVAGATSGQITIPLVNDLTAEPPEIFYVDLESSTSSRPSSATSMMSKIVYILDDDGPSTRTIVDIVSGSAHICFLDQLGGVRCSGANGSGQLGQGHFSSLSGIVSVPLPGPALAISAGHQQTCAVVAVSTESRLYCWGANANGSFGLGDQTARSSPVYVTGAGTQVNRVVHNRNDTSIYVCILVYNAAVLGNSIRCAGSGFMGQMGNGSLTASTSFIPQSPALPSAVSHLALGRAHGCATVANGDLYCWGANDNNQLGLGTIDVARRLSPTLVATATGISSLAVFFDTTCIQRSATSVECWGQSAGNSYANGAGTNTGDYPGQPANLSVGANSIVELRAGRTHACALLSDSTARCWGTANANNQSGYLFSANPSSSAATAAPFAFQLLRPLWTSTCFLSSAVGMLSCVGSTAQTTNLWVDPTSIATPTAVTLLGEGIAQVQQASQLACYRTSAGRLRCLTPQTQATAGLGEGTTATARYSPVDLSASGVTDFAISDTGGCYLRSDQTIWCWGQNTSGSVGDGSTTARGLPVFVLHRVSRVRAGSAHFCALRSDSTLWCWGNNSQGQVGVGSTTNQTRPVQVLDQVTDFAVGNQFTCAIRANRILCWGRNADGEMGDGSGLNRTSPNEALDIIPGTMVAIEAGSAHACVRHDTGLVKCWGDNGSGQLGRGDTSDAFIPWLTLGSGVQSMALGQDHSCFLMADQTVRCVGNAQSFQTGTGSTATITNLSTAPTTLSTVSTIWTGRSSSTCALQTNNSVQCWGRNSGLFIPRFPPLSHLPRPIPLAQ